ncbi:membrane protein RL11I [Cercopithecine betaherpesvirus 5]|uniref:Membrane protein RL11I n=1 Tax=Simian cytomegalovirus (strain Colburn) TaxID=50292 RepID=G8XT76_SCMVC|nr:membrane protein RL11I [Cercopithecine betaherpesvirus 5]AEV80369.1 membrane protein RL11I [Cercopithecine betaherpesvirus 5]
MTLHPAQRLWIACYVSWILVVIPITHGSTTATVNTTAGTQLTTNDASTPAMATIQTTTKTSFYSNTTIEATANDTATQINATTAATNSQQTTLPAWPVEIYHNNSLMWANDCYCGSLTVPVGANFTLNGTQDIDNTISQWFYANTTRDLLCAFWNDNTNYTMNHEYVNYTCTIEHLLLLNLSTKNTGVYYNVKESVPEHTNYTFICYNLTVSANATNTTNSPAITTTKCGSPPWKGHWKIKTIHPNYQHVKLRVCVLRTYLNDYKKIIIQYSWLSTVFLCAFTYLLFALHIPQRLYYVCCKVQPRIRGYRGLIEDDY